MIDGIIKILLTIGIIILVTDCKPSEKVIKKGKIESLEIEKLENVIEIKKFKYQTLIFKKIGFNYNVNGKNEKLKGTIGIIRDSLMIVSVIPALGYESARIWCTKDSIIILNRPDKQVIEETLDGFLAKYGIIAGFDEIQSILSNESFYYKGKSGNDNINKKRIIDDNQYVYRIEHVRRKNPVLCQSFYLDTVNYYLNRTVINDYKQRINVNIKYSDFHQSEIGMFPRNIRLGISENDNTIEVNLKIGQMDINKEINAQMKIPGYYKRIDI